MFVLILLTIVLGCFIDLPYISWAALPYFLAMCVAVILIWYFPPDRHLAARADDRAGALAGVFHRDAGPVKDPSYGPLSFEEGARSDGYCSRYSNCCVQAHWPLAFRGRQWNGALPCMPVYLPVPPVI